MDAGILLLYAAITILSMILFVVTLLSYVKTRNRKLFFVSLIFLFLLIRGGILSVGLFYTQLGTLLSNGYIWVIDLLVLILLYVAYSVKG